VSSSLQNKKVLCAGAQEKQSQFGGTAILSTLGVIISLLCSLGVLKQGINGLWSFCDLLIVFP
jgi:hypothetical protein